MHRVSPAEIPADEAANAEGVAARGPVSADILLHCTHAGEFDPIPVEPVAFDAPPIVSLCMPIDLTPVDPDLDFRIARERVSNRRDINETIVYARRLATGKTR